jgi:hypothetical protein
MGGPTPPAGPPRGAGLLQLLKQPSIDLAFARVRRAEVPEVCGGNVDGVLGFAENLAVETERPSCRNVERFRAYWCGAVDRMTPRA